MGAVSGFTKTVEEAWDLSLRAVYNKDDGSGDTDRIDSPESLSLPPLLIAHSCSSLSSSYCNELLKIRSSMQTYCFLLSFPESVEISLAVSA